MRFSLATEIQGGGEGWAVGCGSGSSDMRAPISNHCRCGAGTTDCTESVDPSCLRYFRQVSGMPERLRSWRAGQGSVAKQQCVTTVDRCDPEYQKRLHAGPRGEKQGLHIPHPRLCRNGACWSTAGPPRIVTGQRTGFAHLALVTRNTTISARNGHVPQSMCIHGSGVRREIPGGVCVKRNETTAEDSSIPNDAMAIARRSGGDLSWGDLSWIALASPRMRGMQKPNERGKAPSSFPRVSARSHFPSYILHTNIFSMGATAVMLQTGAGPSRPRAPSSSKVKVSMHVELLCMRPAASS